MVNKYGMVLISYVRGPQRTEWAQRSFDGLIRTNIEGLERPVLRFVYKPSEFDYMPYFSKLRDKFIFRESPDPPHVVGLDPVFIWSANDLLLWCPDVTHLIFMTDDVVYNPEWLHQLDALIARHPDARAWTVYRSSYEDHHKTLGIGDTGDYEVRSISGIGTMTVKEWQEYNPDWKRGHGGFPVPWEDGGGNTLDLHHAWERKGQRWATANSYWEHIGVVGTHGNCALEKAYNFVGE